MGNSYRKTRFKIALLYFSIILLIITIFSYIVIRTQNQQFQRLDRYRRPPREFINGEYSQLNPQVQENMERVDAIINEIKYQNLKAIILFDLALLILASVLSYYLSGKTLEPILETLNKQKRFISDASHELKTPLTNIKTEAEVLMRSKLTTDKDFKDFTRNVITDVDHLNELVTSLLDAARFENKSIQIHLSEFDLIPMVNEAVQRFKESANSKSVKINVVSPDNTINVSSDKGLLQRLVSILVDNAIKYNKVNGQIDINILNNPGKHTRIEIKDTGVGIDEKELPKIFDRFYRISEDRNEKGFGLGLSIAKQLAKELNIEMTVKSKVGEGTKFTLNMN